MKQALVSFCLCTIIFASSMPLCHITRPMRTDGVFTPSNVRHLCVRSGQSHPSITRRHSIPGYQQNLRVPPLQCFFQWSLRHIPPLYGSGCGLRRRCSYFSQPPRLCINSTRPPKLFRPQPWSPFIRMASFPCGVTVVHCISFRHPHRFFTNSTRPSRRIRSYSFNLLFGMALFPRKVGALHCLSFRHSVSSTHQHKRDAPLAARPITFFNLEHFYLES